MIALGVFAVLSAMLVLAPSASANQVVASSSGPLRVETLATGLELPWSLAFLPDRRMLVTERPGRLRIVDRQGRISPPVAGMPAVYEGNQGGLLDVALDRHYPRNGIIYFCFVEPLADGGLTALARAQLIDEGGPAIAGLSVIFRQDAKATKENHYGCRIVQTPDGNLFLTLGDSVTYRHDAQNPADHTGKIVRLRSDGAAAPGNPFIGKNGARAETFSLGHRNVQGAALHPRTGKLWIVEHGPRGGDELNIIAAGRNYGWPIVGHGVDYSGEAIHEGAHKEGMEPPVHQWTPSIAPSGMAFYGGSLIPAWRGHLFVGALAGQMLVRLRLDGEKVVEEERLLQGLQERIRDVRAGPDGALWLLTDNPEGRILRVAPAR